MLDALAQRVEEGGGGERGRGNADAPGESERVRSQRDQPDKGADQEAGQYRVGESATDQPVDLIEPVFEDPDADADRQRGQPDRERGLANES